LGRTEERPARAFNRSPQWAKNMNVIIILILASLAVGLGFVGAFIWSVRNGQYEDTTTPSLRILTDEPEPGVRESKKTLK